MQVFFWLFVVLTLFCVYMIFRPMGHSENPVDNWIADSTELYLRMFWVGPVVAIWTTYVIAGYYYGFPWK